MKTRILIIAFLFAAVSIKAATTIDSTSKYAYGGNIGWINWAGDTANGAVIGGYVCSGYIYSANVGWINLGGGSPANSINYQNNSSTDFGVNSDALGNLRGYAWGANIGWLNFEDTGAPKIDLTAGNFTGYVWSANCGWISLSNAVAYVKTDSISPGTLDANGLPIAWELTYFGQTNVDPNADPDHDGMSNLQEYLAGTNPTNASDYLAITAKSFSPGGTNASLTWNSTPSRYYYILKKTSLASPSWTDSGLGLISPSAGASTSQSFTNSSAAGGFFRIQAIRPLTP